MYVDVRYELLRAAPRIDHGSIVSDFPSIRVLVDPSRAAGHFEALAERRLGRNIPAWALDWFSPYSLSMITSLDRNSRKVKAHGLLNLPRLGAVLPEVLYSYVHTEEYPEIEWPAEGIQRHSRGALTLDVAMRMDDEALEAARSRWNSETPSTPLQLEGRHLVEAVFDNRDGGAYLAVASFMRARGVNLNEEERDISLSSLQFVRSARLELNPVGEDALAIRLALEVVPEARDRIAVHNMKAAMDEGFEKWGERLAQDHGLKLTGTGTWRENVLDYDFRLRSFDKALDLFVEGELF